MSEYLTYAELNYLLFKQPGGVLDVPFEMWGSFLNAWDRLTPLGRVFMVPNYAFFALCILTCGPVAIACVYLTAPVVSWLIYKLKPLFVR